MADKSVSPWLACPSDNKITRDVLHIHAWHCVVDFSKHKWFAGKYRAPEFKGIPKVAKDDCLCVASNSLDGLRKLVAFDPK
jgi:hypothetical protein